MEAKKYSVNFDPPVVKDQPHRILDTTEPAGGIESIDPNDFGSISTIGGGFDIDACKVPCEDYQESE